MSSDHVGAEGSLVDCENPIAASCLKKLERDLPVVASRGLPARDSQKVRLDVSPGGRALFGVDRDLATFEERNHQGLGNELIVPLQQPANMNTPVECRERLGGILRYYYRQAA
ncbi:MAG: hypothetical protein V2A73_00715 [Pseudomonadota bacterium]